MSVARQFLNLLTAAVISHPYLVALCVYLVIVVIGYVFLMVGAEPDPEDDAATRRARWMAGDDPDGLTIDPELEAAFGRRDGSL